MRLIKLEYIQRETEQSSCEVYEHWKNLLFQ